MIVQIIVYLLTELGLFLIPAAVILGMMVFAFVGSLRSSDQPAKGARVKPSSLRMQQGR